MTNIVLCVLASFLVFQASAHAEDATKNQGEQYDEVQSSPPDCNCENAVCEPVITADKCPHGLVTDTSDSCRCCPLQQRCGNGEYEFCDPDGLSAKELAESKYKFGRCGRGLECRTNYGIHPGSNPEMVCFCEDEKMVCGSDGVTYDTECQMEKIAFESGRDVGNPRRGMCKGAPTVVTPPDDVTNSTTGNVYLQCEVIGNPVPRVEWRRVGTDNFLPMGAGTDRFTVQTRGGPEEYEVTGWLQISRLEVEDGGEYECVGINKFGEDSGQGNIVVVGGVVQESA